MSGGDDWAPGDLALCVRSGPPARPHLPAVKVGSVLTVAAVLNCGGFGVGLDFEEYPPDPEWTFAASHFRKIRPHTPDAEDAETIRLLTGKPVREAA